MGKDLTKAAITIQFCDGGSCKKAGSEQTTREARAFLRNNGYWNDIHNMKTRCNGRCEDAPTWIISQENSWYKNVSPEKGIEILKSHLEENKPLEDYLLFKNGWSEVKSDNERIVKKPIFQYKFNENFGEHLSARMISSDQYMYPLFQFLMENHKGISVEIDAETFLLTEKHKADYSDLTFLKISGKDWNTSFAIGKVEKDASYELASQKIAVVEVIWKNRNEIEEKKAIVFKSRKGTHLFTIHLSNKEKLVWNHILKIYLDMDFNNYRIEEKHAKTN
ncbi:(2Fe-2S) ferredoxin domain-containing protein [Aureivirga sp. CE67]|uniref:(2Fe-2S) ferredoxin domain-containing protein n=1 Tax=Aureivirga sp. CE67 TaxID=1788983 RepID=UPI0018CAA124|nr:hypothetical protein [Aureivirga sp. CE67]